MQYEKTKKPILSDSIFDLRIRKNKTKFFTQINKILDWKEISRLINKDYSKGNSAVGIPAYEGLLLFKMCLLQTWYGLSDTKLIPKHAI